MTENAVTSPASRGASRKSGIESSPATSGGPSALI